MAPAVEKKIDPEDGVAYTFEELSAFYKGKFKKAAVAAYWEDECKPVKKKGKAKEPEPKAKAKVKAKAKSEPKAKAKAKAEPAPANALGKPATAGQNRSGKPVNVAALTKMTKDDLGLLPQPLKPRFKSALVGIYVRSQPYGGSDKSSNGHR
eukprot:CAMPEP_0197619854 /NCGR_PEP_ID=MMETSP1338-20131121/833_1 /TAXON_ID=43686 ORGANISM="Pelagodinium beii, Strain RCC1491" /NCGR_SAMPLE_ID=MMETSP1338 /ASSEMBLY_ACC=CAM_ASM_000754 /LENGTH=151 /DNA_ID=CAMNT_0043188905 /DNA_START=138 /DNA_END=590 /DNA_ORIENTATION=-